jgi:hypothetical protein
MRMFFNRITLAGDYSGHRDAGITYKFRFAGDRAYFYVVEQRGRWRLAHRGQFRIATIRDPKYSDRSMTIVRFEPRQQDVRLDDQFAMRMLEERALLIDRAEEYIVTTSVVDDEWRAGVKRRRFQFMRPDPASRAFSRTWHLESET